ncbi:Uncharacterised protein [Mycobacterium tuberculosis]|nr:Uncharacterised protein [Mycobacterium tuberculosis]
MSFVKQILYLVHLNYGNTTFFRLTNAQFHISN